MYSETEGIIFRQTKTVDGRRMVLLFSKKYGKISMGSSLNERSRSKAALALRPFTLGRYDIYKKGDYYHINGAETVKSFYSLGEDLDKYMIASRAMELTDKALTEGQPVPRIFNLLVDFLNLMEYRTKGLETPLLAYQVKLLKELGYTPELKVCAVCGKEEDALGFSIKDGGIICGKCIENHENLQHDRLIYTVDFGIVNVINYFLDNPLERLKSLALSQESLNQISQIIREYQQYHLEIGPLKSEGCLYNT